MSVKRSMLSFLVIAAMGLAGCPRPLNGTVSIEVAWRQGDSLLDHQSKNWIGQSLDLLVSELLSRPKEQREQEYRMLLASPKDYESKYLSRLAEAFVVLFVKDHDEELLRELLAARCPRYVGGALIERYLTLPGHCEDAVALLVACHGDADNDFCRKRILTPLASAFKGIRRDQPDNDSFVAAVAKWYQKNKGDLQVNGAYGYPRSLFGQEQELFIRKTE